MPIGVDFPLQLTTGSLGLFKTTDTVVQAVEADARSLLLTNWGERVMHYSFGCNLREFLFEQMAESVLRQRVADRVLSQFDVWLPFVSVDVLNVIMSEEDPTVPRDGFAVRMRMSLTSDPDSRPIEVFVPVA